MGADLLPIGMLTDVSAGALGGGGGALPFSGQSEVAGAFQSFLEAGDSNGVDGSPAQAKGGGSVADNLFAASFSASLSEGALFAGDIELASAVSGDVSAPVNVAFPSVAPVAEAGVVDVAAGLPTLLPAEPEVVGEDADLTADPADVAAVEIGYVPALVVGEVGVSADLGPSQVVESGNATSLGSVDDVPEAGLLFGSAGANAQQASEQISSDATPLTPAVDLPGLGEVDAAPETSAVDAKKTGAVPGSVLGSQNEAVPIGAQVGTGLTDAAGASAEQAQKVPDAAVGSAVVAETKSATGDVPILGGVNAKAEQLDDGLSSQEQLVASSEKPGANLTGADEAALDQAKPRRWKVNLPEIARAATAAPQGEVVVSPDAGAINAMAKADGMVSVNSAASAAIDMQALGANTAGVPQQVAAVDGDANAAAKAGEVLSGLTASKNSGAPGSGTVKQELSGAISDADGEVLAEDSEADLQSKPFSAAKPDAAEKAIPSGGAPVAGDKQARDGNAVTLAVTASSTNAASDDEAADDDSLNLPLNAKPFGSADATGTSRHEAVQTSIRAQTNPAAVQVAGAIAHNLKNGNTRFQMRFDPPELGRVDVHMKMSADGSVHAHLVVERPETLDMFLRDQRALERALVSAGLNTEGDGLQFSLQDSGGQGFGSSQDESFAEGREPGFGSNGAEEGGETLIKVSDVYLNNSPSGLDIRI